MSTYDPEYDLTQLMADFKTCATAAGFCTIKFGKPTTINFDHNICYDLLNIDYPTSYIAEGIKEVYTFKLTIARPTLLSSTQGVQTFDDDVVTIFAAIEIKSSISALDIHGEFPLSKIVLILFIASSTV